MEALAALSDTTAELASLRDLDETLSAICRRARALLTADAAYIALRDARRGDSCVRASDGIVSESFRRLRLPASIGVGGLAAARGTPIATSDYLEDERFAHTAELDRCVRDEGLRAIVGVPLRRGEEVIGVLLAGSRAPRRLEPTEVAWLQALATHAAIAIHDRRLEAAAALHAELARVVVEGGGPADVIEAMGRRVGAELELLDAEGTTIAGAGATLLRRSEAGAIPIVAGSDRLGTLRWVAGQADLAADRGELLERGCAILASQLLGQRVRSEARMRERGEFVAALFDRPAEPGLGLERDAARLGISLDLPHVVVVAELAEASERWAELRATRAAAETGGAARVRGGEVVALVSGEDPAAIGEQWMRLLAPAERALPTVGVSRLAAGIEELRAAQAEARDVLGLLRALGRSGVAASALELGLLGLVFGRSRPRDLEGFVGRVLGPLLRYDAERPTGQLLATVAAYFDNEGQLSNTARALSVHVNTLYGRLERVDELLGEDWRRSSDRRLELHLALRLRAIAERLESPQRSISTIARATISPRRSIA